MSQITRRTRVRQLAESVLPGRAVGGYANLIAARLRKLAAEGSSGMLPMSGDGDGAIFFRRGRVVYAESSRTPSPQRRDVGLAALGLAAGDADANAGDAKAGSGESAAESSLDRLLGMLALVEPTVDAVTDLVSSEWRYAKFRSSDAPPVARAIPLPMEQLLAEVERRRQVLRQLAPVVGPDTTVARYAPQDSPRFQVSAPQWALLVRAGDGTTPRTLALALGRSVFGTTIEVYRLLALGLLAVPGHPPELHGHPPELHGHPPELHRHPPELHRHPPEPTGGSPARRPAEVMSFMRALSDAGGSDA